MGRETCHLRCRLQSFDLPKINGKQERRNPPFHLHCVAWTRLKARLRSWPGLQELLREDYNLKGKTQQVFLSLALLENTITGDHCQNFQSQSPSNPA
jgi:hypothetical protein